MTYIKKPIFRHPSLPTNEIGLTYRDYEGVVSTLCAGCGHDSITASIIDACYELSLPAHKIAKLSEHFKKFKKDKHSTIGLTKSVNKRKKLLNYLKNKNVESYQNVIKQLNLRK